MDMCCDYDKSGIDTGKTVGMKDVLKVVLTYSFIWQDYCTINKILLISLAGNTLEQIFEK